VSYASRQWAAGQAARDAAQAERYARQASLPAIDYAALRASQDAEERERNRERTPEEMAVMAAQVEATRLARLAQPGDIAKAEKLAENVPAEHRAEWIKAVIALGSRPPMHHIENVRVSGMSLKNGYWVVNAVMSYDGGGSGYGRHAD